MMFFLSTAEYFRSGDIISDSKTNIGRRAHAKAQKKDALAETPQGLSVLTYPPSASGSFNVTTFGLLFQFSLR